MSLALAEVITAPYLRLIKGVKKASRSLTNHRHGVDELQGKALGLVYGIPQPTPTFGQIQNNSEQRAGDAARQGSNTPVPDAEAKAAPAALAAAARSSTAGRSVADGDDDEDDRLAEDAPEATDTTSQLKLEAIARKRKGSSKLGFRAHLMAQQAVLVSLVRPDAHRGANFYAAIKDASRRIALTREQRQRAWAAREKNPTSSRVFTKRYQVEIPKPIGPQRTWFSSLLTSEAKNGPAAAKQASRQTTRSTGFIAWMQEAYTKNAAARALAQETVMLKPPVECAWRPSIASLMWSKPNPK